MRIQTSVLSLLLLLSRTADAFPSSTPAASADATTTKKTMEINVEKAFEESTFPITPADLIKRTKEILGPEIGIGTKDAGNCLAQDFEFCAAVVGPIGKEEYLKALGGFELEKSFDIDQNTFGFTVSPLQTNRVYWFGYQKAKLIAPFMGVAPKDNGEETLLDLPPQCFHMDFDEAGNVTEFGFYTVDRRYGNTGGLGGAFGYFYGVGKPLPIPEAHPYKPSFRFRALTWLGSLGRWMNRNKKSN
eukprot:CAMPEP_0198149788 /NCGR_PEP_ID=MMETSP1443-20131203/48162_1 /TAXON_ID=186043 /ORGANISM="Entomoneis sp., Strain CCMP2396" /LENGTH=244 /DNA_ID=CAMNT_0043814919 /DNA_START=105 /DNA_END=839 /DNA_ORIENTATION=-